MKTAAELIAQIFKCGADEREADEQKFAAYRDPVVVETMPEWLRASHEAAGNTGRYPGNGAVRYVADRDDVAVDEWTRILRDATCADFANYGVSPD